MMAEDPDRRPALGPLGRELTVIITTLILLAVVLVLTGRSIHFRMNCSTQDEADPLFVQAVLVAQACAVPHGLAVAWRLRPAFWVSTLLALLLTPWVVTGVVYTTYCPD
jgi:hypothetical protein